MAKGPPALVTARVLEWARTTLGLSQDEASRKLKVSVERLAQWEHGDATPTVAQLRKLAHIYKRPLPVFFLPEPPDDPRPPKDYRQLPENLSRALSPRLRFEIRRAQLRQSVAADLSDVEGARVLPSLGSASLDENVTALSQRIRDELGVSLGEQASWRNPDKALSAWILAFEEQGILVFHASQVDVNEMRGMSFHDRRAPAILLNGSDSPNGRIFTLFHELSHLLLADPGICDLYDLREGRSTTNRVERYCNRFAAAFLVPAEAIRNHPIVASHDRSAEWRDDELMGIRRYFSVSTEVVFRRLVDVQRASWSDYLLRRESFLAGAEEYRTADARRKIVVPWERRVIKANGRRFTRLVLAAYDDEGITGSDLSEYLSVDLRYLPKIEGELYRPRRSEGSLA